MPDAHQPVAKIARPRSNRRLLAARDPPAGPPNFLVVGIGASAGGLEAARKLMAALPDASGMAFILVQHLDPTHQSMMVDLLTGHTSMTVLQAAEGMPVEPDHLYVIPPGTYLSVADGTLHLTRPQARPGTRLPFDFLLQSLALNYGPRAACVVLTGTGADGSQGLKALRESGGFVIAQDPGEADYDGMPRNAIATGAVDRVLPIAQIPDSLVRHRPGAVPERIDKRPAPDDAAPDWLREIIGLLKAETAHDFTLYKPGTLQRRIERRMAMATIEPGNTSRYMEVLRTDPGELDLLAKDLLINVTGFFRDPKVFELLAEQSIPDLVRAQALGQAIRVWIAGCSTGEETYSLAMLFLEEIAASGRNIRLQIFASDIDADAIAAARDGLYAATIETEVSPARLARFFSKEEHGYRVLPDLRATVVFTVQDLLADPPFSRIDLVSCRNLLIYLQPEAQAKIVSLFHFALREGGFLLLGSAETVADPNGRFEIVSKSARLYRHIGHRRPGELGFLVNNGAGARAHARPEPGPAPSRHQAVADLCRQLVMEKFAPAAILINHRYECLYLLGPTDRYLRVASGHPTHDLLAMAEPGLRTKLRSAIQQARHDKARIIVGGGRTAREGKRASFSIDVQPLSSDGEELLLVCFVDEPDQPQPAVAMLSPSDPPAGLILEFEATKTELQGAIRSLELASKEQKAINEEALSINEEYQSANEELLASKEELQSLNEELTALNGQLQETLERQRTTSNDLQNVLYSTDVATLFLDTDLQIRFFTPATRSLFRIIPSDVGRPLADLNSLAADGALLPDLQTVFHTSAPLEREIQGPNGTWYVRRVLPYRTQNDGIEGVVVTFADITERKHTADALVATKREAELATAAKSRFLAAASHDLRQPLQTLALLQGLLAKTVEGTAPQKLIGRLDETLGAMSGMLNTLLDISQIEAGTVRAEIVAFRLTDLLESLKNEFTYHAQAQGLGFRVVSCGLLIDSDPRLLEQMIRNLLSNALKYTRTGKVLLGCRRHGAILSIEVWDTGAGIPADQTEAIFEEYHQLHNAERERNRGLGLGLSIVRRLGDQLGHRVSVRSQPGRGSVFSIDVMPHSVGVGRRPDLDKRKSGIADGLHHAGAILVVEDDPEVRDLLELLLIDEGHRVVTASDGNTALQAMARGEIEPDLILTDYNLPNGIDGLQLVATLRERHHRAIPAIVLTGDVSTGTLSEIARRNCRQIKKPIEAKALVREIENLLSVPSNRTPAHPRPAATPSGSRKPVIYIVDDDMRVRNAVRSVLEEDGRAVEDFATCESFLETYDPACEACLLIDAALPGMTGLELLQHLGQAGHLLPSIMITGKGDVSMAVHAMKAGALDFIEKPIGRSELVAAVDRALEQSSDSTKLFAWRDSAANHMAGLTSRQRDVMTRVLAGHPSKNIAVDLGISQRTVENHRAAIMKRTGTKSLPELARLAMAAAWQSTEGSVADSRYPSPPS